MLPLPDLKTPLLWLLGVLLVAALVVAGVERTMVLKARADLAQVKTDLSNEKLARSEERLAAATAAKKAAADYNALKGEHATTQQRTVDEYETKLKNAAAGRAAAVARADGLSRDLAAYAARDREAASTDPAACSRIADRSQVLAGVASEGIRLLQEGRELVEGRDAEVGLLLGVINADRALLDGYARQPAAP